jgi:hypothetical protein
MDTLPRIPSHFIHRQLILNRLQNYSNLNEILFQVARDFVYLLIKENCVGSFINCKSNPKKELKSFFIFLFTSLYNRLSSLRK